jgi:hypothetical protein
MAGDVIQLSFSIQVGDTRVRLRRPVVDTPPDAAEQRIEHALP